MIDQIREVDMSKPRLTKEAATLVERYRFLNSELDRYCGSAFYRGEGDPRERKYLDEQSSIAARVTALGFVLDLYY
jgi:hypothetical protein